MTRFILKSNLKETLHSQNWPHFAKRYNGPNYAKNQYDMKLESAWVGWKIRLAHEMPHTGASISLDKPIPAI
ncbi:hypothetical protein ACI0FR_01941 [Paenochrobactrum sp. BZR 201-1]